MYVSGLPLEKKPWAPTATLAGAATWKILEAFKNVQDHCDSTWTKPASGGIFLRRFRSWSLGNSVLPTWMVEYG